MISCRLRGRLLEALEVGSARRVQRANPKGPIALIHGQFYFALFSFIPSPIDSKRHYYGIYSSYASFLSFPRLITLPFRRKPRRKTITLAPSELPTAPSLSESAFSPSPMPARAKLPPIQTNLLPVSESGPDYPLGDIEDIHVNASPRRTSRLAASSPLKKAFSSSPIKSSHIIPKLNSGSSTPGGSKPSIRYDKEGGGKEAKAKAYGRGTPRTLTLPAHLTDSLMKMRIGNREDNTSVESFLLDGSTTSPNEGVGATPEGLGTAQMAVVEAEEVMDVDMDVPQPSRLAISTKLGISTNLRASPEHDLPPPPSPRKKKRRARSLPPTSSSSPVPPTALSRDKEEEGCDADDEGGGGNAGDDGEGLLSPVGTLDNGGTRMDISRSRGNSPGIVRRSARRLKPKSLLDRIGGLNNGMPAMFNREYPVPEEMEEDMAQDAVSGAFPRKRARTREGSWIGKGDNEDERVVKRVRKR